jgi:hypothetical protein
MVADGGAGACTRGVTVMSALKVHSPSERSSSLAWGSTLCSSRIVGSLSDWISARRRVIPRVRAVDAVGGQIGLPVFAIDVLVDGVTATNRRDRRASVTFRTRRRCVAKSAQIVGPYSGAGSSKE